MVLQTGGRPGELVGEVSIFTYLSRSISIHIYIYIYTTTRTDPPIPHSTTLKGGATTVHTITHARSWLRDTLKRKLVDFASNRRFFYLPGACLPFFG